MKDLIIKPEEIVIDDDIIKKLVASNNKINQQKIAYIKGKEAAIMKLKNKKIFQQNEYEKNTEDYHLWVLGYNSIINENENEFLKNK